VDSRNTHRTQKQAHGADVHEALTARSLLRAAVATTAFVVAPGGLASAAIVFAAPAPAPAPAAAAVGVLGALR